MSGTSFLEILLTDVARSMERYAASGSDSDKRNLVRTTFAAIEGVAWIFREHVVQAAQDTYGLEPDEIEVLRETTYQLSQSGVIRTQSKFIALASTIRLIARIAERIAPAARIDFGTTGWSQLRDAIHIRNRITHPKGEDDLLLSDADVAIGSDALYWLLQQTSDVMAATNTAVADYMGEFRSVLEKLKSGDSEMHALYESVRDSWD